MSGFSSLRVGRMLRRIAPAAAIPLALTACGGSGDPGAADAGGRLRIGMASEAQSLDPPNYVLAGDLTRMNHLYEGLVKLNDDGSIAPSLATDWKQLSDIEWEFTLREGVTFHDGTPFDAAAVETSLERASAGSQGQGFLGAITGVVVVDDGTVDIELERPFASLLHNLTVPAAAIVSPAALEEYGEEIATHPVGTGQYELVSWTPDTSMLLERYDDYWGERAALDEVEFLPIPEASTRLAALEAGDVDVIENPPPSELQSIESSGDLQTIVEPRARPIFLGFNLETVPDVDIRRAVAYAIDKDAIVDDVLEGVGRPASESLITPELLDGVDPVGISYDPDKARELLAGKDSASLEISLAVPTERYLRDQDVAEVIAAQLSAVGLKVDLEVQEPGTWYQTLLDHKTQMYWLGWGLATGDPADIFERVFHSGVVNNMSQVADPAIDSLIDSLSTTTDTAARQEIFGQLQRIVVDDQVIVIPVYHSSNFYATRSSVHGFATTINEMIDLSGVTVD